jgi:hypothetical protein
MTDYTNLREQSVDVASHQTSNGQSLQNMMLDHQVHLNVTDTPVKPQDAGINATQNISFDSKHNKHVIRTQSKYVRRRENGDRQNREIRRDSLENSRKQFGNRMGRGTSTRGRGRGRFDARSAHMNPNWLGHQRFQSLSPRRGLSPRVILPPPPPPASKIGVGYFSTPNRNAGREHNQFQIHQPELKHAGMTYQDAYRQHQPMPTQHQQSLPLRQDVYPPREMASNFRCHSNSGDLNLQSQSAYYHLHYAQQSHGMEGTQNITDDPNAIASNWSIHLAPCGVDYYYNYVTRVSTYHRPPCLGSEENNATRGSSSGVKWTKHVEPKSGKTYYFNGVSTTWTNPFDFQDQAQLKIESDTQPLNKKKKTEQSQHVHVTYKNKEEAVSAFKCLLLEKGIIPGLKWNEVQKLCCVDKRWEAVMTIGERKQALAEYQTKRANDLKEEKRQERVKAKDGFMQMLTEKLTSISTFTGIETRFKEIRDHLVSDERFCMVDQERDREDIYIEFIDEVRKRDERKRDDIKRQAKADFVSFLEDSEKKGALTYSSTWAQFISSLSGEEKKDNRFCQTSILFNSDKQEVFDEFIKKLKDAEKQRLKRIHDTKLILERAQRDDFVKTLIRLAKESKIFPFSRWHTCEEILSAEDTYGPVNDQDKNFPRDLFQSFVDDWYDNYRKDRLLLHDIVIPSKLLTDGANTKYSVFSKNLLDASQASSDTFLHVRRILSQEPVSTAKLLFDELISKLQKGPYGKRMKDDSSESEGEIIEDEYSRESI